MKAIPEQIINELFDHDATYCGVAEKLDDSVQWVRALNSSITWKPISDRSIPLDGREFLARYGRQQGVVKIVSFNTVRGYFQSKGEPVLGFWANVTHWVDIPEFVEMEESK